MRQLKNYNNYFNKCLSYCDLVGIKVFHDKSEYDGTYSSYRKIIILSHDLNQQETIAVFLHEIGHYMQDMFDPNFARLKSLNRAYANHSNKKTLTARQKQLILECEKDAWNYGRILASKLKIKLGAWYSKEESAGLDYYKNL